MDDEEKILMKRETEKHYEAINKIQEREKHERLKRKGYDSLQKSFEIPIKIFMGYLAALNIPIDNRAYDLIIKFIVQGDLLEKINHIMSFNISKLNDMELL